MQAAGGGVVVLLGPPSCHATPHRCKPDPPALCYFKPVQRRPSSRKPKNGLRCQSRLEAKEAFGAAEGLGQPDLSRNSNRNTLGFLSNRNQTKYFRFGIKRATVTIFFYLWLGYFLATGAIFKKISPRAPYSTNVTQVLAQGILLQIMDHSRIFVELIL